MASLADVAALSGVSISTVRRVLYGLGPVRAETTRRVNEALAHLSYVPNPHARALVGAKNPLVALIVPQLTWYVANVLVVTLHQQIATLGLRSVFFASSAEAVDLTVRELQQLNPQAVVLVQVNWFDAYRRLPESGLHLLGIDLRSAYPDDLPADTIGLDRPGAFRRVTEHLLDLGHQRIALLDSFGASGRQAGYAQALEGAGIRFRAVAVADSTGEQAPSIPDALSGLLTQNPELTGLVCTTDLWAQEAAYHLAALGHRIPADMSLTGYSNEPWTQWTTPSLTTLDQGTRLLCDHTLDMMSRRLEGSTEPWSRRVIQPELVVRQSTAPPRAGLS